MMFDKKEPSDLEGYARGICLAGLAVLLLGCLIAGPFGVVCAVFSALMFLAACYSRQDGLLLVGPFAQIEMIRYARRGRPWLWRVSYLIVVIYVIFATIDARTEISDGTNNSTLSLGSVSQIANHIISWIAILLAAYCILLSFTIMPGIVTEERETKRWDVLLATDLRPREIIIGKIVGRSIMIIEPILCITPVVAILLLLGGFEPLLFIIYTLSLVATLFSITGIAIFYSVFFDNKREAGAKTRSVYIAYMVFSSIIYLVAKFSTLNSLPSSYGIDIGFNISDLRGIFAYGNPVAYMVELSEIFENSTLDREAAVWAETRRYISPHFVVGLVFGLLACSRLLHAQVWNKSSSFLQSRRVAQAEKRRSLPVGQKTVLVQVPTQRPDVPDESLAWWERFGHLKQRQVNFALRLQNSKNLYSIVAIFLALGAFFRILVLGLEDTYRNINEVMYVAIYSMTIIMTLPMVIGSLIKAAYCIARERTQDTIQGIYLMPLTGRAIVFQKLKGVILHILPQFILLYLGMFCFMLFLFVHPLTFVLFPFSIWSDAVLAACFGIFISSKARSSQRAVWYTILYLVGIFIVSSWIAANLHLGEMYTLMIPYVTTTIISTLQMSIMHVKVEEAYFFGFCFLFKLFVNGFLSYLFYIAAVRRFESERTLL